MRLSIQFPTGRHAYESVASHVQHRGNWMESRMCRWVPGAVSLCADSPGDEHPLLVKKLSRIFSSKGLHISCFAASDPPPSGAGLKAAIEIVGNGPSRIVNQIAACSCEYRCKMWKSLQPRWQCPDCRVGLIFQARARCFCPKNCQFGALPTPVGSADCFRSPGDVTFQQGSETV